MSFQAYIILKIMYNLRMFVGTHKNKKKKIEKTIGNKRSRVGTNRRWYEIINEDSFGDM